MAINIAEVEHFCSYLTHTWAFGFGYQKSPQGLQIQGETRSRSGIPVILRMDAVPSHVEVKIFDANRRLLYTAIVRDNINNHVRLKNKLERILTN